MAYVTVTGAEVNHVQSKLESVFNEIGMKDDHKRAVCLTMIIMIFGRQNDASREELIEGFEEMVLKHYDDIESISIA